MWIPQHLIEDNKLDWINKVLLSEILSLSRLELGCIASNETFGKLLNIHKGNISKRISFLVEGGYIRILLKKQGENKTKRTIVPLIPLSGNAQNSKRERTEEYAETQQGVSGNASSNKRERSSTNTSTNSFKNSFTNSDTNSLTNSEEVEANALADIILKEKNIK